jgi:hypothetical protein
MEVADWIRVVALISILQFIARFIDLILLNKSAIGFVGTLGLAGFGWALAGIALFFAANQVAVILVRGRRS